MKTRFFEKGLITEDQLKKISYLSFTNEIKEIISLITRYSRKLKKQIKISFYFDLISTAAIFTVIVSLWIAAPVLLFCVLIETEPVVGLSYIQLNVNC